MTTAAPPDVSSSSEVPRRRDASRTFRRVLIYLLSGIILVTLLLWQSGTLRPEPRVAIVTASSGPYWDAVVQGARDAADRYHIKLAVLQPHADEPSQTAAIQQLMGKGFDGVAISPNDPPRQAALLAQVAGESKLVTYDSDCPVAGKLLFIGSDNYDAGRMVGHMVKEAIPDGGEVLISIGSLEKENGQRRRQGVIDELLDRSTEKNRPMDAVDAPLPGTKYTIVETVVDGIDPAKATDLLAAALKRHPNVKCVAALFAYSTPSTLKALEQANLMDKVKVVGFDTNEETLAGIEQGHVAGTIMQNPYNIGFESVRVLGDAARGDKESIPMFATFYFNCDPVTKDNLSQVRAGLTKHPATTRPTGA